MKKLQCVLLALLMLSLSVAVFAETWKTFSSEDYGYSLKYPGSWQEVTALDEAFSVMHTGDSMMPTIIMVVAKDIEEEYYDKSFEENIQQAIEEFQNDLGLEGMGTFEVKNQEAVDVNGHEGYWVQMNISVMEMFNMRVDLYRFEHKDHIIILSFNGDAESYQDNSEVFDAVVGSFNLK